MAIAYRMFITVFSLLFNVSVILAICAGTSLSSDYKICDEIAEAVEKSRGLPQNILTSISLVEAGRKQKNGKLSPWPWSLNHAGTSLFFDKRSDALKYLNKNITKKFQNIDVGCMQVNVKWHRRNFDSFAEMLDPRKNIQYAASFLVKLKKRYGSWEKAIKHYHSSTERLNVKYYAKVREVWSSKEQTNAVFQDASLSLDDNIFYNRNFEFQLAGFDPKATKPFVENKQQKKKSRQRNTKFDQDNIYFDATLGAANRFESNEELKRYIRVKSAYLRDNVDKIILFREEFSKTR